MNERICPELTRWFQESHSLPTSVFPFCSMGTITFMDIPGLLQIQDNVMSFAHTERGQTCAWFHSVKAASPPANWLSCLSPPGQRVLDVTMAVFQAGLAQHQRGSPCEGLQRWPVAAGEAGETEPRVPLADGGSCSWGRGGCLSPGNATGP